MKLSCYQCKIDHCKTTVLYVSSLLIIKKILTEVTYAKMKNKTYRHNNNNNKDSKRGERGHMNCKTNRKQGTNSNSKYFLINVNVNGLHSLIKRYTMAE